MRTAKLFASGKSQAARPPKEFRFPGSEVCVSRLGKMVVLYSKDDADNIFFGSLGKFTDDFFTSIESARAENISNAPRLEL
jgi:antitoxin VapB